MRLQYPISNIVRKLSMNRSSHQRCSTKKDVLRNFSKFTGKHLRQSLFFNKIAGLRPANLLKKRLWHRYFPKNFAKFLRTPFLQNTFARLLLDEIFELASATIKETKTEIAHRIKNGDITVKFKEKTINNL